MAGENNTTAETTPTPAPAKPAAPKSAWRKQHDEKLAGIKAKAEAAAAKAKEAGKDAKDGQPAGTPAVPGAGEGAGGPEAE